MFHQREGERLMCYYRNRMEWETFFQVKVGVLLLCSEMEINLKAYKQNPRSTHTMNDWLKKIILSLNIKVPSWDDSVQDLSSATLSLTSAETCTISWASCPGACSLTFSAQPRLLTSSGQFVRKLLQQCDVSLMKPEAEVTVNMFSKET